MKKNTKLLLTLTLVGTTLFSCSSSVTPINGAKQENQQTEVVETFNIVNSTSEYAYLDGLPEKGEVGKTYSFRVSLKPGYHFNDKVTINCGDAIVDATFENGLYSFVMPNGDITISLDVGVTDFTITNTSMFIEKVLLDDNNEEEVNIRSATAGTALKFEVIYNDDFHFSKISMNNTELEEGEDGYYHFVMPSRPVVLSSDKLETYYNLNLKSELTLSSLKMYTDEEEKTETKKAYKGQKVYMDLSYLSEATKKVAYTFDVNTTSEDDADKANLEVKQVETTNVYYFEMISSDIDINITEKDCTKLIGHTLVNKNWKTWNLSDPSSYWSSPNVIDTKEYTFMLSKEITFTEDGDGKYGAYALSWNVTDSDNFALIDYSGGSSTNVNNKKVYFTNHLILTTYSDYNSSIDDFSDLYVGTYSSDYAVHSYIFNKQYRIIWIEDKESNILENIMVINNKDVYTNLNFKNDDNNDILGSDITVGSKFNVYDGDKLLGQVNNNDFLKVQNLKMITDENTEVVIKDKNGNNITSSLAGETVYVYPKLKDNVGENIALRDIKVVSDSKFISVSKVEGQENVYSFVVPNAETKINVLSMNSIKYQDYPVLGKYITYNLSNGYKSADMDYSSSSLYKTTFEFFANESIEKIKSSYSSSTTESLIITSLENVEQGKMAINNYDVDGELYFANGLMVTPYSVGKSSYMDVYIGIRVPEGKDETKVKTQVHFNYQEKFWAISFYLEDELFGSIFNYNDNNIYTGVEFTFEEGSTRINSTASYHVVKDGVTLFDVNKDKVTPHVN